MARPKKSNKLIPRSIGLTAFDWAIIEKIAESNNMSNSAVFRDMLIIYMFSTDLMKEDISFRARIWDYYDEAIARAAKRERETVLKKFDEEELSTLKDEGFPKLKEFEKISTPEDLEVYEEKLFSRFNARYTKEAKEPVNND